MKKDFIAIIVAIIIVILSLTICQAQTPKDTTKTIPIHYIEMQAIKLQLQKAEQLYHKWAVMAPARDTLDMYINNVFYFLNRREQSIYTDTVKKTK